VIFEQSRTNWFGTTAAELGATGPAVNATVSKTADAADDDSKRRIATFGCGPGEAGI
jgi:hypothetical protein